MHPLTPNHLGAEASVLVEGEGLGLLRKTQADSREWDSPVGQSLQANPEEMRLLAFAFSLRPTCRILIYPSQFNSDIFFL